jgi:hypothetical protein
MSSLPSRRSGTLLIACGLALLPACTVFLPTTPPPAPTPTPTDPCLDDGRPEVHVLVAMRMDRTVVNLADTYAELMTTLPQVLLAMGARPTRVVLLPLDEHRGRAQPLAAVGCGVGGETLVPRDVIAHYARAAEPRRAGDACAVTPLLEAGAALSSLVTDYPPELDAPSGQRIFGAAPPDAVIVLHLDSLSRSAGLDEPACADAAALAEGPEADAGWLSYDPRIARDRVYHWMIASAEGVSPEAYADACRRVPGVAFTAIDVIEPSARSLYDPLAARILARGGYAARGDLCTLLGDEGQLAFFTEQLSQIAQDLGLDVSVLDDPTLGLVAPVPPEGT